MTKKKEFNYFTYKVGRYLPTPFDDLETFVPYKSETKKLVWNVISYDFVTKEIAPINLFEYNWVFLRDGLLYAKKHYSDNFIKFAECVRSSLQHEYWSRAEYEVIISGWPSKMYYQKDIDNLQKELNDIKKGYYKKQPELAYVEPDIGPCYKLDVYTQVMMNWDRFIDYVWINKHLITKKKLGLE